MNITAREKLIFVMFAVFIAFSFTFQNTQIRVTTLSPSDYTVRLLIDSDYATNISDINFATTRDFYYTSSIDLISEYDPVLSNERIQLRLNSLSPSKFAIAPYSGDIYMVEKNSSIINVIENYIDNNSTEPGLYFNHEEFYTSTSDIVDIAFDPTDPYEKLYFSVLDETNRKGYIYYLEYGVLETTPLVTIDYDDFAGVWKGEFTFDRYGDLFFAGGGDGSIYHYKIETGLFTYYYTYYTDQDPSIVSFCFDRNNYLYFTTGDSCIWKMESLAQALTDFSINNEINVGIVLIGYDYGLISESDIFSKLPGSGNVYLGGDFGAYYNYKLNYRLWYSAEARIQELNDFVLSNSRVTNTSRLNMTALQYQADNWEPQDIFLPKNGTAIDALAVENWIAENFNLELEDYTIFCLNFTFLDNDQGDHWFEVPDVDADSGVDRHWYRNEWDNPMNFDAEFPYPGYTGYESSNCFVDFTSFQWYLEWRDIWSSIDIDDGDHEFYDTDLDHFMEIHDYRTSQGKEAINDYIGDWLAEVIPVYLTWDPLNGIDYTEDLSVQLKVFNGVTDLGFTNDDLNWTVNTTQFENALFELLPESTVDLDVEFLNMSDYPDICQVFADNVLNYSDYGYDKVPLENYTYYNGYGVFYSLFDDGFIQTFFDQDAADLVVTGYAFILDNSSFAYPGLWAGGGLFTGLGGGGKTLQLMELDRLYYPNRTTPRQGFSKVLVHETGHSLGFPHTFTSDTYAGDFSADTMGYYGGFSRYSKIRIETFHQYAAEQEIFRVSELLNDHMMNETEGYWLATLQDDWTEINERYTVKDYIGALKAALDFEILLEEGYYPV
ncbi:MAG: hypothetical protein ACTSP4_12600, partial [Candidatus Hodarchaeales archaeon]